MRDSNIKMYVVIDTQNKLEKVSFLMKSFDLILNKIVTFNEGIWRVYIKMFFLLDHLFSFEHKILTVTETEKYNHFSSCT